MFDVERFCGRDRAYFDEIIDRHSRLVMQVVSSFSIDPDHADDLFQEVWLQIYERAPTYSGTGSIRAWIFRIAQNICVSEHRSRRVRTDYLRSLAHEADPAVMSGWSVVDPLTAAERAQQAELLRRAITALPPRQRQTLTLVLSEGLDASEVAELMDVSAVTVRSNLRHAIKSLRTILEEPGEQLPRYQLPS